MNEKILEIIFSALREAGKENDDPALLVPDSETRLYGRKGHLDSIALVSLIADVEQRVAAELGKTITLADDRAMSQQRSPFLSVSTLASYVETLLTEA